jgi:hypothetical protein
VAEFEEHTTMEFTPNPTDIIEIDQKMFEEWQEKLVLAHADIKTYKAALEQLETAARNIRRMLDHPGLKVKP